MKIKNKRLFVFYILSRIYLAVYYIIVKVIGKKLNDRDRDLWEFWGKCNAKAQTAAWGIIIVYYTSCLQYYIKNTKIYRGLYRMCI